MGWQKVQIEGQIPRKHGQCSLAVKGDRLIVVFPRSCFGGKQKSLSLNLVDNPKNRAKASQIVEKIQNDIDFGQFDHTLEKYRHQTKQEDYLQKVKDLYPEITLLNLWDRYFSYKKPMLKETTIHYLETSVTVYLDKSLITSPYQALELREWLLSNTTQSMAKRVLTYVNAAFKFGLKHKLVKGVNPWEGMATELKHAYELETKPNAFILEERERVIAAFANHQGNWNGRGYTGHGYSHYTNFVKFLFLTGCRPNEAIGLTWADISPDFRRIDFNGGVVHAGNARKIDNKGKGSKNNKRRSFPCNLELQNLLQSIKPPNAAATDWVFPSPKGGSITYGNFSNNAWNKIVDPIKPGTTPYSCRDTFITEQVAKGVNPAIIAKWTDNSTTTIERHYLDGSALDHILPQ